MFICGHSPDPADPHRHARAEVARRCAAGATYPCGWQVQRVVGWEDEGELRIVECGAAAWDTPEGGFACEDGHSHVPSDVRWREGWDYAADPGEALLLAKAGTRPVAMDGGPIDIAPF